MTPRRHPGVWCPYCRRPARLVDATEIYVRSYRVGGKAWLCRPCGAWVGTHRNSPSHKPLGRLANAELRAWKQRAHEAFDPLYRFGFMSRSEAYGWLAREMKLPAEKAHIGMFGVEQCRRLVELLSKSEIFAQCPATSGFSPPARTAPEA